MASNWYPAGLHEVLTNGLSTQTVKAMLVTSSYTYNQAHSVLTDLTATEVDDSLTYARITVTSPSFFEGTGKVSFTCDDLSFADYDSSDNADGCVLFLNKTTDADHIPFVFIDHQLLTAASGATIEITIDETNGLFGLAIAS